MNNFSCFVCFNDVVDAHLCPHCSKMCCYSCANCWLSKHKTCAHCRLPLNLSQMVVFRWAGDVARHLRERTIALDRHDTYCTREGHQSEKVDVFCVQCNASMCHRCALFEHQHAHKFASLQEIYECRKEKLKGSMECLRKERVQLAEQLRRELNAFKFLRICLDRKTWRTHNKEKLRDMQLFELRQQLESKQLVLDKCEIELEKQSKAALIEMSDKLISSCKG